MSLRILELFWGSLPQYDDTLWLIMTFAIILPVTQLVVFSTLAYLGFRLYKDILSDMAELVDKLGVAFIEDRQTYRMIAQLVEEERKSSKGS